MLGDRSGLPVASVLYALRHLGWEQRREAALTLGRHAESAVVDGSVEASQLEQNTAVLIEIVASLHRIRDPRAAPALEAVANWPEPLNGHEEEVRDAAVVALQRLRTRHPDHS
jgi:HEAT repeat protein